MCAVTAIAAACSESATEPDGEGELGEWVRSGGLVRTYELRIPSSYDGSEPAPLLIAFHGWPDTGAGFEARSGLTQAATAASFITVYPDGLENTWGAWDLPFIRDLVQHLSENLTLDPDRMYVTGFSAGGLMTLLVACAQADRFAAAAVVGATLTREVNDDCDPDRPIPILFVHGTEDSQFPWEGSEGPPPTFSVDATLQRWAALNGCDATAADTLPDRVDDGTRVWTERWTACDAGSEVMLYGVGGGGHTWPAGPGPFPPGAVTHEISSHEIMDFLARQTR